LVINDNLQIASEIRHKQDKINTIIESYPREIFLEDRTGLAIWKLLAI